MKRTTRFNIPLYVSTVFLANGSFKTSIRTHIISPMTLIRLRSIRASTLLHYQISLSRRVAFLPSFFPLLFIHTSRYFPALLFNNLHFIRHVLRRLLAITLREKRSNGVFFRDRPIAQFRVNANTRSYRFFLFCFSKASVNKFTIFVGLMDRTRTSL